MNARTAVVALCLAAVLAAGGAALLLTIGAGDEAAGTIEFGGDADGSGRDAVVELRDGRRHVGAGGEDSDATEDEVLPEGPVTRKQRLQWIREWLEIACGQRYSHADRTKARRAILEFDEDESVPLILELVLIDDLDGDGDNWGYWGWAMSLLGELGPRAHAAVPDLMKLLRRDEERADSAAYALARIGAPAIDPLLTALGDGSVETQRRALYALAYLSDPPRRVTEAIVGFLGHADETIRVQAISGLIRAQGAADIVIPALIGALSDASDTVRWQAVLALHARGREAAPAVAALSAILDDEYRSLSFWAAKALGSIGPAARPQTEKLVSLLAADPARWKEAIPEALSRIGTRALLSAVSHEDARVRAMAIPFLPAAVEADADTADAAVTALEEALTSDAADVRRTAAEAAGRLGSVASATVTSLLKLAEKDADGRVRRAALIAVVRVGGARDDVLAVLVSELRDGPGIARVAAAEALGELGTAGAPAVDALAAAMSDPDHVVRERAARALGAIGPAAITAASTLAGRLGDDVERVRLASAIALISVDPPGLAARDTIGALRISDAPKIRKGLMQGLGGHPNAVWLDVVVDRIDDRDANVREAAAQAAGTYTAHSPTIVPALIARLERERIVGVQIAIADALARHGKDAADAVPLLERIVASPRTLQAVRERAREALPKLR